MQITISKSQFKPQVLGYLRMVEKTKKTLVVTHAGKPTIRVTPYTEDPTSAIVVFKDGVVEYKNPTEPVEETWEILK